jgi:exocyst complex component 4
LITAEIKARAAAAEASRPRVDQVSKVAGGLAPVSKGTDLLSRSPKKDNKNGLMITGNGLKGPPDVGPQSKAQVAAQELLESILDLVLRILGKRSFAPNSTFDKFCMHRYFHSTLLI